MTPTKLYLYALDRATTTVEQVLSDQLSLPTPDTEWNLEHLLAHVLYELAWTADVVTGRTMAEVGDAYEGDLLGDDPIASWRKYDQLTRRAVEQCDESAVAHLSYANKPVGEYLMEAANDQLIHAWDIGQAIGVTVEFGEAVSRQLYEWALERHDELSDSSLFAPPIEVPDSASIQTKLLALLGRPEHWK